MCQLACVHAMLNEPVPISTLKLRSSIGRQELFLYGLETPGAANIGFDIIAT